MGYFTCNTDPDGCIQSAGKAPVNGSGFYLVTVNPLSPGEYGMRAFIMDLAGNVDRPSHPPLLVTILPLPLCSGQPATIVRTAATETINGTAGRDVIHAYGGNDTINALGGNDIICAGPGNDTVNGGDGNDALFGQSNSDTLNGNNGADRFNGGNGTDVCNGGAAVDKTPAKACETRTSIP